jgi:hypothetical protein
MARHSLGFSAAASALSTSGENLISIREERSGEIRRMSGPLFGPSCCMEDGL